MGEYLGKINIKNFYVNFKPLYEYTGDNFIEIDLAARQNLLPDSTNGTINFYSDNVSVYDVNKEFIHDELVIFSFDPDDLEPNFSARGDRNLTGYKVNVAPLSSDRIRRLHEIDYYYCVSSSCIEGDYKNNSVLIINDPHVISGMKIMLPIPNDDKTLIGPLEVSYNDYEGKYIVKTNLINQKFVIWGQKYVNSYNQYFYDFGPYDNPLWYIQISESICSKTPIDVIPLEQLIKEFKTIISSESYIDGKLDLTNIDSFVSKYEASMISGNNIPEEILNSRLEILTNILTSEEQVNNTFGFISETIGGFLLKHQDKDGYSKLIEAIVDSPDFMDNIQKYRIVSDRVAEKEAEIKKLEQEAEKLEKQIEEKQKQEVAESVIKGYEEEINALKAHKDELEEQVNSQLSNIRGVTSVLDLQKKSTDLDLEIGHKEYQKQRLVTDIQTLEAKLDSVFSNSAEKALNFSFDGMLSSRMLRQAAKWENDQRKNNYDSFSEQLLSLPCSSTTGEELVEYLISRIKQYRPSYDRNTILNILICISQGFLTVFSGEPGTGKTSICKIVSNVLGLNLPSDIIANTDFGINPNRFINISVERGWTTKRDFIGYYNPLTKTFDQSNRQMFDCLSILDIEAKKSNTTLPYLILLDEANLSPMEYYWADFMNVCDDLDQNSTINMGENYQFRIPSNLRFLATINNDHTTESLSPRLIDRAWIIRLPKSKTGSNQKTVLTNEGIELISWKALADTLGAQNLDSQISGAAKEIYDSVLAKMKEMKISVSTRVDGAIQRYWSVAQHWFESDSTFDIDSSIVAIDYAIAQRILPHINVSGEKMGEELKSLLKLFSDRQNQLRYSAEILAEIIQKGDEAMSYYKFFS